jgi:adenosylcobinamide-phosphate synthase
MRRSSLLAAAWLLDRIAGDPEWFPHPVRLLGAAIERGESALRRPGQSETTELVSGAVLTAGVVAATYCLTAKILHEAHRRSEMLGGAVEIFLSWTCLAARNLEQEATAVTEALMSGDLLLARRCLARIVGRDTEHLDASEISRAVIETVAESGSDGVIAPLFYMTVGGVPLAMAYKAVNTLDSMIGHTDARYFYFGKAAARLDDTANYLPARLTALGVVAAAQLSDDADSRTAWRVWQRDGNKHKSPNAGQPESAMAGALGVRLGGENVYAGEVIPAQYMGEEFPAPSREQARRAIRLVSVVSLLGVGASILLAGFMQRKKSR